MTGMYHFEIISLNPIGMQDICEGLLDDDITFDLVSPEKPNAQVCIEVHYKIVEDISCPPLDKGVAVYYNKRLFDYRTNRNSLEEKEPVSLIPWLSKDKREELSTEIDKVLNNY